MGTVNIRVDLDKIMWDNEIGVYRIFDSNRKVELIPRGAPDSITHAEYEPNIKDQLIRIIQNQGLNVRCYSSKGDPVGNEELDERFIVDCYSIGKGDYYSDDEDMVCPVHFFKKIKYL